MLYSDKLIKSKTISIATLFPDACFPVLVSFYTLATYNSKHFIYQDNISIFIQ